MNGVNRLMLRVAIRLLPRELRARKQEEYLADFRDAESCGIPANQVACGALGASLAVRTKAARQGIINTGFQERKNRMKLTLSTLGATALLAAGLGLTLPTTSASPGVTHMTADEMWKNAGWTDVSTLIISDKPATSTPIGRH